MVTPSAAEVWRDGDRLIDIDPAVSCRAEHAAAGMAVHCPRHTRVTADRIELRTGVLFEYDKAVLRIAAFPVLDEVAAVLRAHPDLRIEVQGHGRDDQHRAMRLSEKRAQAVRQYLIQRGVDAARLTAQGYGDTVPRVMPSAPEAERKNRRIELRIMR